MLFGCLNLNCLSGDPGPLVVYKNRVGAAPTVVHSEKVDCVHDRNKSVWPDNTQYI